RHIISNQKVGEALECSTPRCIGFLRSCVRSEHAGLNTAVWSRVEKTAERTGIVSRESVFILAVIGIGASELHRVTAGKPAPVAGEVVLVREVVVVAECGQRAETICRNGGHEITRLRVSQ